MSLLRIPFEPTHLGRRIDLMTVTVLREWIGRGEVGGNNRGDFVSWLTQGRVGAWCAALQWTALDEACTRVGARNPIPWHRRVNLARGLLKLYRAAGREVAPELVREGDYLCLERRLPWQGHAQRVSAGEWPHVKVIDGNVGSFKRTRGRVREIDVDLREARIVGLARLG